LRAANDAFAGRMRPAGREFETPAVGYLSNGRAYGTVVRPSVTDVLWLNGAR